MQNLGALGDRGTVDALIRRYQLDPGYNLFNMSPEVVATVPLDGDGVELLYHQGYSRWVCSDAQAAVAAQVGRFQFRVKDNSTSIVILERCIVSSSAAAQWAADFGYGPGAADLATLTASSIEFRDGRTRPAAGQGDVVLSHDTNAAASLNAWNQFAAANVALELPGTPLVLFPGNQVLVNNQVVNQPVLCTWVWRSRRLMDQENTG